MEIPQVLALPLQEAARRLEAAGYTYEVQPLMPPRASEADFEGRELSANRLALTIVYR